jgi:hypothetical protein
MTKARAKTNAIRMPGKSARRRRDSHPEASHDGASPKESLKKHETLRRKPRQGNRRGSRLPIPSEPAPCHRPWITPQGATPAEHYNTRTQLKGPIINASLSALQIHTLAR